MYTRQPFGGSPFGRGGAGGGFGLGGPVPKDVWVLLAVIFATFSLQFFAITKIVPAVLRLTTLVWQLGFLWQVVTYPFVGVGGANFWLLLELFILFLFARDVFFQLGRRNFWLLLAWTTVPAALFALLVDGLGRLLAGGGFGAAPFLLMQGQRTLIAVLICAFAVMNRRATILLFFVLPIQASWFIPLEIILAFFGYLNTGDLAGFLGLCAAIGATYSYLTPGGLGKQRRELWLRLQQWWLRRKMNRLRRRRGMRVVGRGDDWVN